MIQAIKLIEPKLVREYSSCGGSFYCPNCYDVIETEYSNCCTVCGQHFSWKGYRKYAECISWDEAQRRKKLNQKEL